MTKKISKKLREDAANLCSANASWWATGGDVAARGVSPLAYFGVEPVELACKAILSTVDNPHDDLWELNACDWAEAEAMLREGWSP